MYAILNIKTYKWVYGTDFTHPHFAKDGKRHFNQRTSANQALTYESIFSAQIDFEHRGCGRDYRIIEVCLIPESFTEIFAGGYRK